MKADMTQMSLSTVEPPPTMSAESNSRRRTGFLYLTVMITGAAVMVLELLGARIIGAFYGVSLYVWSSIIAVTLIALALGYYLGGFIADRLPRMQLPHVILLAVMITATILFMAETVLSSTDS